jgi:hypothetical protein
MGRYQYQLKATIQPSGQSLQEFTAAVEAAAHRALIGLPVNFIHRPTSEAARPHPLRQVTQGRQNQVMTIHASADGAAQRLTMREVIEVPMGTLLPPADWHAGSVGTPVTSAEC